MRQGRGIGFKLFAAASALTLGTLTTSSTLGLREMSFLLCSFCCKAASNMVPRTHTQESHQLGLNLDFVPNYLHFKQLIVLNLSRPQLLNMQNGNNAT